MVCYVCAVYSLYMHHPRHCICQQQNRYSAGKHSQGSMDKQESFENDQRGANKTLFLQQKCITLHVVHVTFEAFLLVLKTTRHVCTTSPR